MNKSNTDKATPTTAARLQAKALFAKKKVFAQKLSDKRNLLKSLDSSKSPVSDYL
ncbi:hypothetical protein LBY39_002082 [Vibrio parahaemolyticus]|nr:hypothetical protein [Vibrio parahaemolyticus]